MGKKITTWVSRSLRLLVTSAFLGSFLLGFGGSAFAAGTATIEAVASASTVTPGGTGTISVYLTASTPGSDGGEITLNITNATFGSITWAPGINTLSGTSTTTSRYTPLLFDTTVVARTKLYDITYTAASSGTIAVSFSGVNIIAKSDSSSMTATNKNASIAITVPPAAPTPPSATPTTPSGSTSPAKTPTTTTTNSATSPTPVTSVQPADKVNQPSTSPNEPSKVVTGEEFNKAVDGVLAAEKQAQEGTLAPSSPASKQKSNKGPLVIGGSLLVLLAAAGAVAYPKRRLLLAKLPHKNSTTVVAAPMNTAQLPIAPIESQPIAPAPLQQQTQTPQVIHSQTAAPVSIEQPVIVAPPTPTMTPESKLIPGSAIAPGSVVEPKK